MISEKLSTDSRRMLQNGVPQFVGFCRCTPCRQRRGKDVRHVLDLALVRCTPCRQRRGKGGALQRHVGRPRMHPVQAAPRQRSAHTAGANPARMHPVQAAPRQSRWSCRRKSTIARCTPCRQRRGKVTYPLRPLSSPVMHPVQAAPRQRMPRPSSRPSSRDAPRAGSAEAKRHHPPGRCQAA